MAKEPKKYNPKVTFDGSFEDLLGMTFNKPKYKFKVGDRVKRNNDTTVYVVIASRETGIIPYGSDYSIEAEDKSIMHFVKEDEIHLTK